MDKILKDYAEKALVWLESGAAWIADEIPVYVNEILKWEMVTSIMSIIIGAAFLICIYPAIKAMMKYREKLDEKYASYDDEHELYLLWLIYIVPAWFALIPFIDGIHDLLRVIVAPRVYLIQYLTALLG